MHFELAIIGAVRLELQAGQNGIIFVEKAVRRDVNDVVVRSTLLKFGFGGVTPEYSLAARAEDSSDISSLRRRVFQPCARRGKGPNSFY